MKRIQIKKDNIVTNQVEMPEAEALSWLEQGKKEHWFGRPAVYETKYDPETMESTEVLVTPAEEYEVVITDITLEIEQEKINAEAEAYLKLTDWYVTRFAETGVEIPEEVKLERQAARERIVR